MSEPRGARFEVIPTSILNDEGFFKSDPEKEPDYIILEVSVAKLEDVIKELQDLLNVMKEPPGPDDDPTPLDPNTYLGVHLYVRAFRQVYSKRDGTKEYPPTLLANDID